MTIITKVHADGTKQKRRKCKPGFKLSADGSACLPQSGAEKALKKVSIRHAVRTKNAQGASYKKRTIRKRLKALRKRKQYGL